MRMLHWKVKEGAASIPNVQDYPGFNRDAPQPTLADYEEFSEPNIVYVDRPVEVKVTEYIDREVEVVKTVTVEVEKEVIKFVDREVEVIKHVLVDRPIEIIKEVEKEVHKIFEIYKTPKWSFVVMLVEAAIIVALLLK